MKEKELLSVIGWLIDSGAASRNRRNPQAVIEWINRVGEGGTVRHRRNGTIYGVRIERDAGLSPRLVVFRENWRAFLYLDSLGAADFLGV